MDIREEKLEVKKNCKMCPLSYLDRINTGIMVRKKEPIYIKYKDNWLFQSLKHW
jgi:hypothetical protein